MGLHRESLIPKNNLASVCTIASFLYSKQEMCKLQSVTRHAGVSPVVKWESCCPQWQFDNCEWLPLFSMSSFMLRWMSLHPALHTRSSCFPNPTMTSTFGCWSIHCVEHQRLRLLFLHCPCKVNRVMCYTVSQSQVQVTLFEPLGRFHLH